MQGKTSKIYSPEISPFTTFLNTGFPEEPVQYILAWSLQLTEAVVILTLTLHINSRIEFELEIKQEDKGNYYYLFLYFCIAFV